MSKKSTTAVVKQQYEDLPYPVRNPADEKTRILHGVGSNLIVANHFCFRGALDINAGFRFLSAGGGTGDAIIYMAEQLRGSSAELVYLDLSEASRQVAQERARVRGLDNISWVTGSLEDIPNLDLGEFDFINCSGVLHHLESPEAGLRALTSVLKPKGAMFLMLYGKYARRPIYDIQSLLRAYLPEDIGTEDKIAKTRALLAHLPSTNWFQRDLARWQDEISATGNGDAGLYDLLLHSCDKAFDIPAVYEFAESSGLHVQGFPVQSERYDPYFLVNDEALHEEFDRLDSVQQQTVAELMSCHIAKHEFFVSRLPQAVASFDDEDNALILFWEMFGKQQELANAMRPGQIFNLQVRGISISIRCSEILKYLFLCMDGKIPIRDIYQRVQRAVPGSNQQDIREELAGIYEIMHEFGLLYLIKPGSYGSNIPDIGRLVIV